MKITTEQMQELQAYASTINKKITIQFDVIGGVQLLYDGEPSITYSNNGLSRKFLKEIINRLNREYSILSGV